MVNSTKQTAKASGVGRDNTQSAYAFRFVEVGEPSKTRDEDARSLVRSHVMRDFYERRDNRRRPSILPEKTSSASMKEGSAQQTHRFKVGPQGLQEVKKRRRKGEAVVHEQKSTPLITARPGPESQVQSSTSFIQNLRPLQSGEATRPSFVRTDDQRSSWTVTSDWKGPERAIPVPDSQQPPNFRIGNVMRPESLPTGLGIDPFNTLPPSRSPRTQVLLYHGKQNWLP